MFYKALSFNQDIYIGIPRMSQGEESTSMRLSQLPMRQDWQSSVLQARDRKAAHTKQKSGTDCDMVEPVVDDYAPSLAFASDTQDDNGSSIEPKDASAVNDHGTEQGQSLDEINEDGANLTFGNVNNDEANTLR
eukprot:scaffold170767_cov56-Attheya_sp.AAC.3